MQSAERNGYHKFADLQVSELIQLREDIERLISQRLSAEKRALKEKLARIERYEAKLEPSVTQKARAITKRPKVSPKYRDPETGATWSGRGLMPRWMTAAVEQGRSRDDFRISDGVLPIPMETL